MISQLYEEGCTLVVAIWHERPKLSKFFHQLQEEKFLIFPGNIFFFLQSQANIVYCPLK